MTPTLKFPGGSSLSPPGIRAVWAGCTLQSPAVVGIFIQRACMQDRSHVSCSGLEGAMGITFSHLILYLKLRRVKGSAQVTQFVSAGPGVDQDVRIGAPSTPCFVTLLRFWLYPGICNILQFTLKVSNVNKCPLAFVT